MKKTIERNIEFSKNSEIRESYFLEKRRGKKMREVEDLRIKNLSDFRKIVKFNATSVRGFYETSVYRLKNPTAFVYIYTYTKLIPLG